MNLNKISRRSALGKMVGSAAFFSFSPGIMAENETYNPELKGNIKHSVSKWCFGDIPLDQFCTQVKQMGLRSVELLGPEEWPTLKKHGLYCAMPTGAGKGIEQGFNDPQIHDELVESYEKVIPRVAQAGFDKIICFSGNRNGLDDETGLENCARGLKRVIKTAEKHNITMTMELLNSKVDHPDYQCDHTQWGVRLCQMVGSDRFKLLYDIYHMQIMEGDVIRTIRDNYECIAHYHTGGVPGRNEIDDSQELNYPAIVKAIIATGYKGYLGQEFVPAEEDKLASLEKCVKICDV